MRTPGESRFGKGFIVGKLSDGGPAYSNGHLLLRGLPPKGKPTCKGPDFTKTEARCSLQRMKQTTAFYKKRCKRMGQTFRLLVVSGQGWAFQEHYVREIKRKFPKASLYLGRKRDEYRHLVAKSDGKVVALLAGFRMKQ
jgi:hypothetical protein